MMGACISTYKWYVPCVHQTTTHVSQDPTSAAPSQSRWWTISPKQAPFGEKSRHIIPNSPKSKKSANQENTKIPINCCTLYLARFLANTFDSPFGLAVSPLSRHGLRNAMVGFMFGDWWGIGRSQAISALHPTKTNHVPKMLIPGMRAATCTRGLPAFLMIDLHIEVPQAR